jgi:alpha-tubulin suppressor-like RCC1 family protein
MSLLLLFFRRAMFSAACLLLLPSAGAAVPALLNHQGRIAVNGVNFEGAGEFKFAFVNAAGSASYWSNDGTSIAGSEPTAAVSLTVTKGLYAVLLGDTTVTNMAAVPVSVFDNADVHLRVWFSDGPNGFQRITPDQRLAASPYALAAEKAALATTVPDGAITAAKITPGAVLNASLNGNAATATTSTSFSGALAGDVTGNQAATVVGAVGGLSAAGVAAGATLASAATAANTPTSIVRRDAGGGFSAGTITGTFVGDGSRLTGIGSTGGPVLLANILAPPVKPVVAWGKNDSGQTTVPPLTKVAAIAAGSTQSFALLDTGIVIAWGGGPAVPAGLNNVTHLAAGTAHTLARKSDGTVVPWGDNTHGRATVPVGLAPAINVAAGEKHSLALHANGTVTAWGDNTFGQTTIPPAATNVTAIAAGYDHTLALKADGTVVAWGRNDPGVGQSTVPPGLSGVVAIAAGAYHSLAVKSDGTVVAWGWDLGGQSTVPPGLTGVSKVAGGYAFSVAMKTDGTLVTWGDATDGQRTIPAGTAQVRAIAAGASHVLALRADLIPAQVARLDQDNVFTGSVGVNRTPAANSLEVEGQASKTTAGNWLANSDRRIKAEIQPLANALEKLDQVRLVDFRYTDEYRAAHPGIENKRYLNVIAQEFATIFPDHVKRSGERLADGSPILQVDTYPLLIYSAAAVQELHRENEGLKRDLARQEERIRRLEAALNKVAP